MAKVTFSSVCKSYGDTEVLKGIDFSVSDGEFVALVGPSGCGKSTLLRCLAGLVDITSGEIYIGDDCLLAPDIYISSGSNSFDRNPEYTIRTQDAKEPFTSRLVSISSNCWLGIRTFVAPGLRLGEGTVTGANSVLLTDTEPYSVYAGVPAKKIRSYYTKPTQV